MKTTTIPAICGVALAAMTTAGLSHWWSVRQFVAVLGSGQPIAAMPAAIPVPQPAKTTEKPANQLASAPSKTAPAPDTRQKEFYEALIAKMNSLQSQNQDLIDQVASTNRDLIQLQFRVDTHSEQFRPLPVNEQRLDTSFEDEPGVLPPRAEPVMLPSNE